MHETFTVAVVQMTAAPDLETNLRRIGERLATLAQRPDLAILPECCLCLGALRLVPEAARSLADYESRLGHVTSAAGVPVLYGGVPVLAEGGITNSALLFAPTGTLVARYDKIHLFCLNREEGSPIDEGRCYVPGVQPVCLELAGWRVGLSICYDIRFPELYRTLAPLDLAVCTAAFTAHTGEAHWRTLVRARAIENQCYVAAAGLCGRNQHTGLRLHGHSMVVDPWGVVVEEAPSDGEAVLTTCLHRDRLEHVRAKLPALAGRRLVPRTPAAANG